MRILTACICYTVAKVEGYVLLDVDFIPLQGEYWQTDQMLSAYFKLLSTRFSTPNQRRISLDFSTVGAIMTGSGVRDHLNKNKTLPLSSVGYMIRKVSLHFRDHINNIFSTSIMYSICRQHTRQWARLKSSSVLITRTGTIGHWCLSIL